MMEYVSKSPRVFALFLMLVLIVGITFATTVAAAHRGMCGDGDIRPSCVMFAFGLNIYGMIGLSGVTTLATLVIYVARRRPPVPFKVASILTGAALAAFVLPMWAAGNKLAGAIVVMMVAPRFNFVWGSSALRSALAWGCIRRLDRAAFRPTWFVSI
jgi:hypothetical protein